MKKRNRRRNALLLLSLLAAAWLGYEWLVFPDTAALARTNPASTAWMELREREARKDKRPVRRRHQWRPLSSISPHLKNAVLVTEDAAFFQHEGIDYDEIREAMKINLEKGEIVRGASTITQQLAKNLYLSPSRSPLRKAKELLITRSLEKNLTKRRIFELYLNVIEWGDGIYGAEAAARAYYGKSAAHLGRDEAAALAAVIINPRRYSPVNPNRRIRSRIRTIRARMERARYYPATPEPETEATPESASESIPDPGANPDSPEPPLEPTLEPTPETVPGPEAEPERNPDAG
ncbi:MAG: monofunctional biosynthetic peptidoglycan transglycosylase [Acidobacteria bacterium]|nr:monofunctional biosynthetic peptidoglycan transglycosylase [Acidobacteriota bacterium]